MGRKELSKINKLQAMLASIHKNVNGEVVLSFPPLVNKEVEVARKPTKTWQECSNCCMQTAQPTGICLACEQIETLSSFGEDYGHKDEEVMEEWWADIASEVDKRRNKDKPKEKENVGVDYTRNAVGESKTVQIKEEFVEAGSMVLVNQASKIVVEGVRNILKASALDTEKQKLVLDLLNTEAGRAACICAAGVVLPYLPKVKENIKLQQIAQSMRLTGMSLLGNEAFDSVLVPLVKTLTGKEEMDIGMLFQFANDPGTFIAQAENNKDLSGMSKALKQMTAKFSGLVPTPAVEASSNGKKEKVAG